MTRQQALQDYEDVVKMIDQLMEKKQNLKKIILAEVIPAQTVVPKHDRMQGNVRSSKAANGRTQQAIIRVLAEHGGQLTTKEIAALAEMSENAVGCAMAKLVKQGLINKHKSENSRIPYHWSLAVHRDRSKLNHL